MLPPGISDDALHLCKHLKCFNMAPLVLQVHCKANRSHAICQGQWKTQLPAHLEAAKQFRQHVQQNTLHKARSFFSRTCVAAKTRLQQRILAALKAAHGANRTNLAVIGRRWICWRYRHLKYPLDGHGRCGYSQQFLWSYSMVCSSLRESVLLTWVHAENSELCFTFCFYLATNSSCCMPNVVQLSISIRLEIPWNTSVSWLALEH